MAASEKTSPELFLYHRILKFGIDFQIFTLGFARFWIPLIFGKYREFQPISKEHAIYWTTRYPIVAVVTMATLVKKVVSQNFDKKLSTLFIVSEEDKVVDAKRNSQNC